MTFAVAAGITAAASLGGALLSSSAARSAASTQADAAQKGIEAQTQAKNDQIAALDRALQEQIAAAGGVVTPQIQNAQSYLAQLKDSIYGYGVNAGNVAAMTRDEQMKYAREVLQNRTGTAGDVFQQQQNWMNPVYQAGMAGQGQLLNYLGIGGDKGVGNYGKYATAEFTPEQFLENQDPGYGFRFREGQKAVERQAAARNGLISGAALKASQRFGQDMASQEYQNAFNRYQTSRSNTLSPLQTLTGQGANAAGQLGQYAQNYGGVMDNAYAGYGNTMNSALGNYGTTMGGVYGNQTNMLNSGLGTVAGMQNNAYGNAANLTGAAYGTYGNNVAGVYGNYGNNLSNLYGAQGQANASGTVGSANALTGGLSNAANGYMQGQMLNSIARDQSGRSAWSDIDASNFMTSGAYPPGYRG